MEQLGVEVLGLVVAKWGWGGRRPAVAACLNCARGCVALQALTEESLKTYLCKRPELAKRVGPLASKDSWSVREVGDGNINFVYIVEGPSGALCVKQALPFVRCVGESWPLTQERLKFEVRRSRSSSSSSTALPPTHPELHACAR